MASGRGYFTITCAICFVSVAGTPCCGGKSDDLVGTGGHDANGGAEHTVLYGGATSIAASGAPWVATGGEQSIAAGGHSPVSGLAIGGTRSAPSNVNPICEGVAVPTATGSLSIAASYVTTGSLKGYAYTLVGENSNDGTCAVPACGDLGCMPPFNGTALCAAGVVGADQEYNSVAGVGFKLNQSRSGALEPIPAPDIVSVGITFFESAYPYAELFARAQIRDDVGNWYCVDGSQWLSNDPIEISTFNTSCWDGLGTPLAAGTPIIELDVIVPSDGATERAFSFCMTDVRFDSH